MIRHYLSELEDGTTSILLKSMSLFASFLRNNSNVANGEAVKHVDQIVSVPGRVSVPQLERCRLSVLFLILKKKKKKKKNKKLGIYVFHAT